jgi:hypothetical protein
MIVDVLTLEFYFFMSDRIKAVMVHSGLWVGEVVDICLNSRRLSFGQVGLVVGQ